ncbi:MAG: DUF2130 domain-containing protein [Bacteroidota bacterium]
MDNIKQVECPNCGHKFLLEDFFFKKIETELSVKFQKEKLAYEQVLQAKQNELQKQNEALTDREKNVQELINKGVKSELFKQEKQIEDKIRSEFSAKIAHSNKELEELNKKNQELMLHQIENEKLKRQIETQKQEIELEFEKKFSQSLKEEKEKFVKSETEKIELKIQEKDTLIEGLKTKVSELNRKIEQGSVQLQGEAQEIIIEETLKLLFPFDEVNEIRKGQRGADVVHIVRNNLGQVCGKIYYESKNTKDFGKDWVSKLKEDNLKEKADVCVIVTQAMPDDIENLGIIEGVWICSYSYFRSFATAFRQFVVDYQSIVMVQANKGDKMGMLYDYLTSSEFRSQFEAMLDGFENLKKGYEDEKIRMTKIWGERQKQLDRILLNASGFYGSIKGIAGTSIPDFKMFDDVKLLDSTGEVSQ